MANIFCVILLIARGRRQKLQNAGLHLPCKQHSKWEDFTLAGLILQDQLPHCQVSVHKIKNLCLQPALVLLNSTAFQAGVTNGDGDLVDSRTVQSDKVSYLFILKYTLLLHCCSFTQHFKNLMLNLKQYHIYLDFKTLIKL